MKRIIALFAFILLGSSPAWAYFDSSQSSISGALGFMNPGNNNMDATLNGNDTSTSFTASGFLGIGGDYDYATNPNLSFGGLLRYYTASSSYGGHSHKNTMLLLGPDFKGYLGTDYWRAYFGAGLQYMAPSVTVDSNSYSINNGFGVSMTIGFEHKISDTMWIGMESMRVMGLSGSVTGTPVEDYMAKLRFQM